MSNRNFDNSVIIQRLQNQVYSRNLYKNNTTGQTLINNPQNTDGNSSRFNTYVAGAQTEYFRGLLGRGETVSIGGIVNIPPFPPTTSIIPPGPSVPGAPTNVSASSGNGQAVISFTAPTIDGGSAITGYTVTSNPGGLTASGSSSPLTVSGLTNGTPYTFTVVATNSVGNSVASSASDPVTPVSVPNAPTIISGISTGSQQVEVSFTAPTIDGGSAITGYTVTSNPGGLTASGSSSPLTVTGLTNGTAYTFTVVATNSVGNSVASSASAPVTANFIIQTFTTPGTTSWQPPVNITSVDYLVVGGGGGSAPMSGGLLATGGGGGGMVRKGTSTVDPNLTYQITVGLGGPGTTNPGSPGGNSQFSSFVSLGGRGGGGALTDGLGGAAAVNPSTASTGGRNNAGGIGGGGGGASGNGVSGSGGGTGGQGVTDTITGILKTYGLGGAGGTNGQAPQPDPLQNNTGNGAPGTGLLGSGLSGYSGIVVLKY